VPLPATFTVRGFDHDGPARFDAVDAAGASVLGDGELHARQPRRGHAR
jgi:hypothetical protein